MSCSPSTDNMVVKFVDADKAPLKRVISNDDVRKFSSAAPTLNNTPNVSRNPSPQRNSNGKDLTTRTPPPPKTEDIEAMEKDRAPSTVSRYSNHELELQYMGAVVITCFFTSGMIDAVAFNSWNCFVGMQTGNTVFAALGLGGLPYNAHPQQYVKSFVAIGSFCIGTVFFNILHRSPTGFHNQPSSRRRIIFICSFMVQTLLIVVAAALATSGVISNQPFIIGQFSSGSQTTEEINTAHQNYLDLLPIVVLAFEAAGQVCLSRVLSLIELPTIVLSTLYHDWTADLLSTRQIWRQSSNVKEFIFIQGRRQNKRLASILALFLGAFLGGEMFKSRIGMAGGLWLTAALKGCIVLAFALWPKQKQSDEA